MFCLSLIVVVAILLPTSTRGRGCTTSDEIPSRWRREILRVGASTGGLVRVADFLDLQQSGYQEVSEKKLASRVPAADAPTCTGQCAGHLRPDLVNQLHQAIISELVRCRPG
jgi:hypothetical protein